MSEQLPQQPRRLGMKFHGAPPRGLKAVTRSTSFQGRFGRMFRSLCPFEPADGDLVRLAKTMIENAVEVDDNDAPSNNAKVPAGFTYFGQFLDHDITFDPVSQLQRENDPDALEDFRTPRFDLDSVYGRGPNDNPFLYNRDGETFLIGKNQAGEDDLPRANAADTAPGAWKRALIGDPRNDENAIVSQIQLAFLKYHNKVVAQVPASGSRFDQARDIVRRHYNWILLKDFLPRIVGQKLIDSILTRDPFGLETGGIALRHGETWKAHLRFYRFKVQPFMPVEFSVAAYRFGHSMVRFNYALNPQTEGDDAQGNPKELLIFDPAQPDNEQANDLRGFRERQPNRQIEWLRFFEVAGGDRSKLQVARALDTQLSAGLGGLPSVVIGGPASAANPGSLAARNLLRGKALELPKGQDVALAMGVPAEFIVSRANKFSVGTGYVFQGQPDASVPPIDPAEKASLEGLFGDDTPLWYYILKEAEVFCKGRTLGPVGGRIVAEVFIGLLIADRTCFLNLDPNWEPQAGKFGCTATGKFGMADLVTFANSL